MSKPKKGPAPKSGKEAGKNSSKKSSSRDEAPARSARPGATREAALKPKGAPAAASEVFSGKGRRGAPAPEAYVPGKVCPSLCADKGCPRLIDTTGYCRLFYIKNWALIQRKRDILGDGQLTRYIEEIVLKYPDKYLEAVRGDLASHDAFQKVVTALELETDADVPGADEEDFEEVIGTIKPAIDDDSFE